jgi:hypothetical protein
MAWQGAFYHKRVLQNFLHKSLFNGCLECSTLHQVLQV